MALIEARAVQAPATAPAVPARTAREPDVAIRLEGVGKSFTAHGKSLRVLEPIDLSIARGEFVAIVGPSGCGKSTVLNLIAGQIAPSEGRVLHNGREVGAVNLDTGYMTQKDTLLPWRTVAENIALPLELKCRDVPGGEVKDRVERMLELVGLQGFEKHYPRELSGGMRKRVGLARTLIYEPDTLLLDEPFGALDAQLKLVLHDRLQSLTQLRTMTTLFVTHDLAEAIALADRVIVFSARPGRIKTVRTVPVPRPRNVFTIRFRPEVTALNEELWQALGSEIDYEEKVG
jgi:NitT/TauT family transport system ATP-binding protein